MRRFFPFLLAFFIVVSPLSHAQTEAPLRVVASFSILGDMVQRIGGDLIDVSIIVGPGQDAHDFQARPEDAGKLAHADIIAINGLKFEGWLGRLIAASGTRAKLLVASAGVKPRMMEKTGPDHADHHHDGQSLVDPHAWQDLKNGRLYAKNIAGALIEARPAHRQEILSRFRAYDRELKKLDDEIRASFALLPAEKKRVITSHDAFAYFGQAYGVTFFSPVGVSTQDEPTAGDIAKLIEQIKRDKIHTLFVENMASPRLIKMIAHDTGAHVGGTLFADALSGPNGDAPTYLDLMRHNAEEMLRSMRK